jgi:glycerol-3-phosphate dehydrogenase
MKAEEFLKATGRLHVLITDEETGEQREYDFTNLVVTAGKNWIAARMKDTGSPAQMSHMAVGTTNTAAAAGDTTLGC